MKNINGAISHLREHQPYPATKADIMETCSKLSDFSDQDKQEFMNALPDKTYYSADEVIQAMNWQTQAAM